MRKITRGILLLGCLLGLLGARPLAAAQLQVLLPLGRAAYQTNEQIDISVVRSNNEALPAADLTLTVTGDDASKLTFTFPVQAAALQGANACATDHFHLNGWYLRPGKYTVEAAAYGVTASAPIEVYSDTRRTSFKLVTWGRCDGKNLVPNGEDGFGFNLYYAAYGGHDQDNNIRGGVDYMPCCTMSGGHQMDLRMECDWTDPNVLSGGRARVARQALIERTKPNCQGIHFYDEPGLTWWNDPVSKEMTNNSIPAQMRSFKSAYGYDVPYYKTLDPKDPAQADKWRTFARWKTGLMDAAWQDAKYGVNTVKPDFMTATQSQYGWSAFSDGYYFQITRNLSLTSGHGGYHDWGPGYWHPSFTLEVARARDFSKPNWYLPGWYGNTTPDQFRLEQYLSFQTDIQGMMTPPDMDPMQNNSVRDGITESNKLMGRFGTVFTTMPVTRGPVAILYSLSHLIHAQTLDRGIFYAHVDPHGQYIHIPYIATKLLQQNTQFVVDEDITDGTLQANYKAVILNAVNYLDPEVVNALERFAANGGQVYLSNDSQIKIAGAIKLAVKAGYTPENVKKSDELNAKLAEMKKDPAVTQKQLDAVKAEASSYVYGLRASLQAAQVWADELKPYLEKAGITPVFTSSEPGIAGTRQANGDVEYLFAVNATHDFTSADKQLAMKAAKATITLANDGRPVYDGIRGGAVSEMKADAKKLAGDFSFGPGEMRIFARTTRPIGKLLVLKPVISTDTTREKAPLQLNLRALVLDKNGDVLVGAFPLRVCVTDALGATRYDLYRATKDGVLELSLPLAANDPAGAWKVEVTELLNNATGVRTVNYAPMTICGAMAGATPRAVYFGNDRENMKRFFRAHKQLTLIKGTSDYAVTAAQRFADSVRPWGITCTIVNAADMNKPELDPKDDFLIKAYGKSTWCGPGGYDVSGPCVLFGSPDDNPLIHGIAEQKVLPYAPKKDAMPGRGRGMIAWQLDSIRQGQESVTAIAYDADGMSEAVGCLYETVAAQDPITPLLMPKVADVTPATKAVILPPANIAWKVGLPDRADAITVAGDKVSVVTHDNTLSVLDGKGKLLSQQPADGPAPAGTPAKVPDTLKQFALESKVAKAVAADANLTAIAYWGGTLQVLDAQGAVKAQQLLPQDITGLAWVNGTLVVGQADGQVLGLRVP